MAHIQYITLDNFSKTPTHTLQTPCKNTPSHLPKPSQNIPKMIPQLLAFPLFCPEAVLDFLSVFPCMFLVCFPAHFQGKQG